MGLMRWDHEKMQGFQVEDTGMRTINSYEVDEEHWREDTPKQRHCGLFKHCEIWFDEKGVRHEDGSRTCILCGAVKGV